MPAADPLLEVCDLRMSFHGRGGVAAAVDGVSFSLHAGRTLCLVGESGCGKSATALSILRLIDPEAGRIIGGEIRFDGQELLQQTEPQMRALRGGKIAMIFQEPSTSLNPVLTIETQLVEAIRLHRRMSARQARQEAVRLLHEVLIPEPQRRARQYPHELSGGMKQRVMIAMALAGEPNLLIADEPTTALDVTVQAEILSLLRRIQSERGLAVLLITHDLGVVAELADDVAVMYAGQIVEAGPVEAIFSSPQHPYTQGLLRSLPRIDDARRPEPIPGVVPSPTAWPIGCRFRERCASAMDKCLDPPPTIALTQEHRVACWLHESQVSL